MPTTPRKSNKSPAGTETRPQCFPESSDRSIVPFEPLTHMVVFSVKVASTITETPRKFDSTPVDPTDHHIPVAAKDSATPRHRKRMAAKCNRRGINNRSEGGASREPRGLPCP